MFVIHQYTDDIEVYYNGNIYLDVKRKIDFLGKITSTFMVENEIILETTYDIFLFKKYLSIKTQNLPHKIELVKFKKDYYLKVGALKLNLQRHYLKNPLYTIVDNSSILIEVSTKLNGLIATPIIYNITTCCKKEDELNCLIRFLIEVPPTMDV